jgi:hypothetical protein
MKLSLRKITQKGFLSLHVLLPAILVIAGIGGVGAYVLTKSHASSVLDSTGCALRGRVMSGSTCTKTCSSGAGSHIIANPYDYCSSAVSKISSATCSANNRKWVDTGCARRWQQTDKQGAIQCKSASMTYFVQNPYDKCSTSRATNAAPAPAPVVVTYKCPSGYKLIATSQAYIQKPPTSTVIASVGKTCETTKPSGQVLPQFWYVLPTKA